MLPRRLSLSSLAALTALLSLTTAHPVLANGIAIETNVQYVQVSATPPVTPTNYSEELSAGFTNPGDYSNAIVTYPGPGSPLTLPYVNSYEFYFYQTYATLSALHTAFPLGAYNFTVNAGNQPTYTGQIEYSADSFATSVPALSAATFNGLNGLNSSAALSIAYNSFTTNTSNNANESGVSLFQIYDSTNDAAVFSINSVPSSTGGILPANTLLPNHTYTWELAFEDNLSEPNANGTPATLETEVITTGTFTTGPATPEPATFALIGLGVAGLAIRRRARRRSRFE